MDICLSNFHFWLPQTCCDSSLENFQVSDDIEWPKLEFVPAMQRRRLSAFAKIALYVANKTMADTKDNLPIIFSSRHGDLHKTSTLLEDLAHEQALSPTAFGLSVHNAIPSLYSILTKNKEAINAIAAGKDSFFMALIDAYARLKSGICQQVLIIHADQQLPDTYIGYQDEVQIPHAISMIVSLPLKSCGQTEQVPTVTDTKVFNLHFEAHENQDNNLGQLPLAVAFSQWFISNSEQLTLNSSQYTWQLNKHAATR